MLATKLRASVRFRNESSLSITYDLRGEDKEVVVLSDKLDEQLTGLRQWYSFITRFSFALLFLVVFFMIIVGAYALTAADYFFPNVIRGEVSSENGDPAVEGLFVVGLLLIFGLTLVLDRLRLIVFPLGTFAIGQGVARHKRLAAIRIGVVTVVLVPALLELLFRFL